MSAERPQPSFLQAQEEIDKVRGIGLAIMMASDLEAICNNSAAPESLAAAAIGSLAYLSAAIRQRSLDKRRSTIV